MYAFSRYGGNDKVFRLDEGVKVSPGDLFQSQEEYFLVLGEEVAFPELISVTISSTVIGEIVYPGLLGKKTLDLMHWMVYTWYSNYKNVLKYFISEEILSLLRRETKKKKSAKLSQNLHIFPDLWSLHTSLDSDLLTRKDIVVLSSQSSQQKKDAAFWGIKHGTISDIYTTHAEVFQDFANLQTIELIDPHAWYYTNQQDPRYKIPAVVQEMKRLWGLPSPALPVREGACMIDN